jgi:hypothetical protein
MDVRYARLLAGLVLMAGVWALAPARRDATRGWVHATGAAPKRVKILRFYSTTGYLEAGDTAKLCYSVENAKLVRIAPLMGKVLPSTNRCLEVVPLHTTHYTILAEGFDGQVVMQSLTLAVDMSRPAEEPRDYARLRRDVAVTRRNS